VSRRPVAVGLVGVAVLASLGLSGCAEFDKALGQQQADIYFQQTTSVAFKMKVRAACNGLPDVTAAPIPTGMPLSSALDVVVYNTTGASDADIARLEVCVNKFAPQVVGVDFEDASDDS
jgi:hypothetical protein